MQEINTFLQALLGLIFARYIPESDTGIFLYICLGLVLADPHDASATVHSAHEHTYDHHEQDKRYQKAQDRVDDLADDGCLLFRELHLIARKALRQSRLILGHSRVISDFSCLVSLCGRFDLKCRILDRYRFDLIIFQHLYELVIGYLSGC